MTLDVEKAAVQSVLQALRQGLHDRNAAAVTAQFSPDATIFDLAPPLAHGVDTAGLEAWLKTWDGPVEEDMPSPTIMVGGDLAVVHGLARISARSRAEDAQAVWWQRTTVCLRKQADGDWKIVHEHSSVPFHMDGSFRAAIDLQP